MPTYKTPSNTINAAKMKHHI